MARTNWTDYPSTATPLNAANLNNIETRIEQALSKAVTAQETAEHAQETADNLIGDTGWLNLLNKAGSATELRVRRIGNVIYLSGSLYAASNSAIANGASVSGLGTLPTSCCPTATRYLVVASWVAGGSPAYGRTLTLRIYSDGTLTLDNASGNASSCAVIDAAFVW
ncbi:hypothetical protein [Actinomyces provencensis]|uniref:hypothetical protein n=1 Tax=Actinomyces provencensis TaxID=1720198 RepID=UPI00096AC742|nr:hypothetical protein [Actinomyces provencensis]